MAEEQDKTPLQLKVPALNWDPAVGRGQYANTISVTGSEYEVVLDFSFRTAVPTGAAGKYAEQGEHPHIARIILSYKAALELRDILVKHLPETEG